MQATCNVSFGNLIFASGINNQQFVIYGFLKCRLVELRVYGNLYQQRAFYFIKVLHHGKIFGRGRLSVQDVLYKSFFIIFKLKGFAVCFSSFKVECGMVLRLLPQNEPAPCPAHISKSSGSLENFLMEAYNCFAPISCEPTCPAAFSNKSGRPTSSTKIKSPVRSEEHTSELQSRENLVCRLLLEKKKNRRNK